jgi:membrane protein insertase Oxa1/YidC/SpoIIIJ
MIKRVLTPRKTFGVNLFKQNYFWSSSSQSVPLPSVPPLQPIQPPLAAPLAENSKEFIDITQPVIDSSLSNQSLVQSLTELGFCNPYTPQGWMEILLDNVNTLSSLEWGSSIIIATVVMRVMLLPIAIKAQRAMVKIKDYKPLMSLYQEKAKSLKALGKDGEAKVLNQEMFVDMTQKGVNPFSGLWGMVQVRSTR